MMLTAERLRELVHYDPDTGAMRRRVAASWNAPAGQLLYAVDSEGYIACSVGGCRARVHRLAWLYCTGEWPTGDIDHIDGDRRNNALANLRVVDRVTNSQNQRRARSNNKTGLLGAHWSHAAQKFTAQISVKGKRTYLGLFDTAAQAHEAYIEAKRRLHGGNTL